MANPVVLSDHEALRQAHLHMRDQAEARGDYRAMLHHHDIASRLPSYPHAVATPAARQQTSNTIRAQAIYNNVHRPGPATVAQARAVLARTGAYKSPIDRITVGPPRGIMDRLLGTRPVVGRDNRKIPVAPAGGSSSLDKAGHRIGRRAHR